MNASKRTVREAAGLLRACLVEGTLDENRAGQVVQELATAKPRGYLALLTIFRRLVKLECGRHNAKVESAQPLPADLQTKVLESLTAAYGPGLSTSFSENPELIGGLRIQVGGDVYDGSVRGRLAALERSF
jgi:F-type H+-transporting ATPase subunit delta